MNVRKKSNVLKNSKKIMRGVLKQLLRARRLLFALFLLSGVSLLTANSKMPLSDTVCHTKTTPNNLICVFLPPDGWSVADPSVLSPLVKVGFYGPSQLGFCPSINLAEEKVDSSLKNYLEVVKKIHTSSRHKEWSYLGTFKTCAGDAALTQIDLPSPGGPMRMLQLILIREKTAYILTAAVLKKEFIHYLPTFQKTFRSFQLTSDLYTIIQDENRRTLAQEFYSQVEQAVNNQKTVSLEMPEWRAYQNSIVTHFSDLGPYWQALTIANAFQRLECLALQLNTPATDAFQDLRLSQSIDHAARDLAEHLTLPLRSCRSYMQKQNLSMAKIMPWLVEIEKVTNPISHSSPFAQVWTESCFTFPVNEF